MCPRCRKSYSNQLTFTLKPQKIRLVAQSCRVCGYLWSEDEEMLRAIRAHLKWISSHNVDKVLDKDADST